jgi:primosomal protein N' (replication factor Y) (superfamily II helicase)
MVVDVLAPVAVDTTYSYRAPSSLKLEPGDCVSVPLGTRRATGVVWAVRPGGGDNLKAVAGLRDWPPLRQPLRDFIDWVARWTLGPRGMVLRMAIRAHEIVEPPPPKFGVVASGQAPARMTEARQRVLAALQGSGTPVPKSTLAERAECSASVIEGLIEDGALMSVALKPEPVVGALDP